MPDGVSEWELWFDVSRLRPDEWKRTMAGSFQRAMHIQAAYQDGVKDANDERQTTRDQV